MRKPVIPPTRSTFGMVWKRAFKWGLLGAFSISVVAQPVRPAIVLGQSMSPTYADGALLWTHPVDRPLRRGDVVVADTPEGPVIKRVALLAGDRRVQWSTGQGWVDMTTFVLPASEKGQRRIRSVRVPSGNVFLLGDNLDVSIDSRSFGPIPLDRVRRLVIEQRAPDAGSGVAGETARGWLAMATARLPLGALQPTNL